MDRRLRWGGELRKGLEGGYFYALTTKKLLPTGKKGKKPPRGRAQEDPHRKGA